MASPPSSSFIVSRSSFRSRVVLVTGASRGIGREIALAFGRTGAAVALVARDEAALLRLAGEIGRERTAVIAADLTDLAQVRRAAEAALERFGRVDVLVNNAGIVGGADFLETPPDVLARTVDLNFRATVVLTRLLAEGMARRGRGHIVNVASLAGVVGLPGEATYAGTKAALRLFTAALRPELGPQGITLTDVVIGTVYTDMLDQVDTHPRVRRIFALGRRLGMIRDIAPEQVAAAVVRAVAKRQEVVVLPASARYLYLPAQGLARAVVRQMARVTSDA